MRCPRMFRRLAALAAVLVAGLPLSGCLFVTDTSRMNADVFVAETWPNFYEPQPKKPGPAPPTTPLGRAVAQLPGGEFVRTTVNEIRDPASAMTMPAGPQGAAQPYEGAQHGPSPYGDVRDGGRVIPAVPLSRVDPRFLRQRVDYRTREKPGTVVVDRTAHYLYFVEPGGKAIRYGVGLGRDGYAWAGRGIIERKAKWPRWTPPEDMVARQPDLRTVSAARGGAVPGLNNPLGARALYIYRDGVDTLYRIHGTPDWQSVGKATSSGCVRMFNQDVVDLFERVTPQSEIVVI